MTGLKRQKNLLRPPVTDPCGKKKKKGTQHLSPETHYASTPPESRLCIYMSSTLELVVGASRKEMDISRRMIRFCSRINNQKEKKEKAAEK